MHHALLEWLAEPVAIMDFDQHLTDNEFLSLCFYNPADFIYHVKSNHG
jgi:S-adenosylmethionine-dependent methyltransferase